MQLKQKSALVIGGYGLVGSHMTRALKEHGYIPVRASRNSIGGEVFIPKIPSYRIKDVATAVGPNCTLNIVGKRPGEKLHEEMITQSDSASTIDLGKYYAILPSDGKLLQEYQSRGCTFEKVPEDFSYNSGANSEFLSINDIRGLISKHVDPDFKPA